MVGGVQVKVHLEAYGDGYGYRIYPQAPAGKLCGSDLAAQGAVKPQIIYICAFVADVSRHVSTRASKGDFSAAPVVQHSLFVDGRPQPVGEGGHTEVISAANRVPVTVGVEAGIEEADGCSMALAHDLTFEAVGPGHQLTYRDRPGIAAGRFRVGAHQVPPRHKYLRSQTLPMRAICAGSSAKMVRLSVALDYSPYQLDQGVFLNVAEYASPVVAMTSLL
jgi:hypothetical protein